MNADQEEIHMSLGLDCTIAYQLKKHNLRLFALPFDWTKIKNISSLIDIIDNDFFNFLNPDELTLEVQSDKFFSIHSKSNSNSKENSLIRIKHKRYNIFFPHEAISDTFNTSDMKIFIDKYSRRIERFRNILQNKQNKQIKIYIGLDKISEKSKENLKEKLKESLDRFSNYSNNFVLIFIEYSKYVTHINSNVFFDWKRDYIPFNEIFNKLLQIKDITNDNSTSEV